DLLLTGYYLPQMPDVGFIFDFDSKLVNYKSMQLDDLILNARHEAADEDIKEAYKDIQRYFVEHLPVISLYYPTSSMIISNKIKGNVCPSELNLYRNLKEWYVGGV